jgi:hypothetical protein
MEAKEIIYLIEQYCAKNHISIKVEDKVNLLSIIRITSLLSQVSHDLNKIVVVIEMEINNFYTTRLSDWYTIFDDDGYKQISIHHLIKLQRNNILTELLK